MSERWRDAFDLHTPVRYVSTVFRVGAGWKYRVRRYRRPEMFLDISWCAVSATTYESAREAWEAGQQCKDWYKDHRPVVELRPYSSYVIDGPPS